MSIRMGAINNKSSVLSSSIKHAPIQTENTNEQREVYAKDDKKYKTHGITFPNFTLIDEAGADKIGIFEDASKYYEKKTEEEKTPQQEKEKLNDTFKAILQKIKVDKNKDGKLEAGEFASLSLTKEKRKELSYMMVKHTSEWEYEKEKFQPILDYLDQDPKQAKNKKMFEDRLEKLAFFPKDIVGEGRIPTFIHPISLVEGFVGSPCYCGRDFTVEEMKSIVKELRKSENKTSTLLFNKANCPLPDTDKTYERLTEELNKTMKKYEINTCLRKMHFISQAYHETARFTTTLEGANGNGYNPGQHADAIANGNTVIGDGPKYRGRGFMQLTWKNNYKKYKTASNIDVVTNYTCISNDLFYAIDSGGWFWENGSAWGALNKRADNDDIYKINIGVNGGFNGFSERIVYCKKLIILMKIKDCKNLNLKKGKKLGIYKYSTSSIRSSNYGKNKKAKFEGYDDA